MLRLRKPTEEDLRALLPRHQQARVGYPSVGGTLTGVIPARFHHEHHTIELGEADVFDRAVRALQDWAPQRGAGLTVVADGPIDQGTTVVMGAPLPVGAVVVPCRVVGIVDEDDAWGFAYGTLPGHPESGEERFTVRREGGGVSFDIEVFSRPAHPLARLGAPISRLLQRQTTRRYQAAMRAAVG
jgi:uncharacterized protein (UPF0548 family)